MQRVYVGVDLGSSSFQQVGVNEPGMVVMKREFQTSAAHLVKAFSGLNLVPPKTRVIRQSYDARIGQTLPTAIPSRA
jgi:hypothetical protein